MCPKVQACVETCFTRALGVGIVPFTKMWRTRDEVVHESFEVLVQDVSEYLTQVDHARSSANLNANPAAVERYSFF